MTCPECGALTQCKKCQCPGDGSHYFWKDERPCRYCHRWMTDHTNLETSK